MCCSVLQHMAYTEVWVCKRVCVYVCVCVVYAALRSAPGAVVFVVASDIYEFVQHMCAELCCIVMQCVAVCCSMLQ